VSSWGFEGNTNQRSGAIKQISYNFSTAIAKCSPPVMFKLLWKKLLFSPN